LIAICRDAPEAVIRTPDDQVGAWRWGHQWKLVWLLTRLRLLLRSTQRAATAASRSCKVSKWRLAIGSSTWVQRVSAGCSSGV
jgi:hypothetical protein